MNRTKRTILTRVIAVCLLAIPAQKGNAQDTTSNLEAHFRFENDINDATTNNHDFKSRNGNVSYVTGIGAGMAVDFDGKTSVISESLFDNSPFKETSISVWVRNSKKSNENQLIIQGAYMGFGIGLEPSGKVYTFFDFSYAGSLYSTTDVVDGLWHHIVAINDGSTTFLYIDGILEGSMGEKSVVGDGSSNNRIYLGMTNLDLVNNTGSLDELRIYSRALNACEVSMLYGEGVREVARYAFDTNLRDSTGNQYALEPTRNNPSYDSINGADGVLYFDGTGGFKSSGPFDNSYFKQTTISLWMKTAYTKPPSYIQVLVQGAYMGFSISVEPNTGNAATFYDFNSAGRLMGNTSVSDGKWHHIVSVNTGDSTFLYIDGKLDAKMAEKPVVGNGGSNNRLYLGVTNLDVGQYSGFMNELKIYNRALSACEINTMYREMGSLAVNPIAINHHLKVTVFPNPTTDKVKINLSEPGLNPVVSVMDVSGRMVKSIKALDVQDGLVDFSDLQTGCYILLVEVNGERFTSRIIKQH